MITLIIILVMVMIVLAIALAVSLSGKGGGTTAYDGLDRKYRNEEGDHLYYDQSIIEKKEFRRRFPHSAIRSFRNLFVK